MTRTTVVLATLWIAACGKSKAPPPTGGSATAPTATATVDAAAAAPAAKPDKPDKPAVKPTKISKATRAEYKRRLQAGRTLAKATKWPEAIAELEAALALLPGDDRALAELSFAYMASGDLAKARKAGRAAVGATTDPKLKAAALYNLGRAEETAAPDRAAALYRESLALRPNATVEKRLAGLATAAAAPGPAPLPCAAPVATADEVCACLSATAAKDFDEAGRTPECKLSATTVDGFQTAEYEMSAIGEASVVLIGRGPAGWAVIADLAYVYNPGAFGISEEFTVESIRAEDLGGKRIVRVETSKARQDSDMGVDEVETESTQGLVVCLAPAGAAPTCPLDLDVAYSYRRERLGLAEGDDLADVADLQTSGLPIVVERKLNVTLAPDGTVSLRAERGRWDGVPLGDRKLW